MEGQEVEAAAAELVLDEDEELELEPVLDEDDELLEESELEELAAAAGARSDFAADDFSRPERESVR